MNKTSRTTRIVRRALLVTFAMTFCANASAQSYSSSIENSYRVFANIPYRTVDNWDATLDVYKRTDSDDPMPTLVFLHGGSTARGSKESAALWFMSYLEHGWNVVNVEHRQLDVTRADGALSNTICALRWIRQNAEEYGVNPGQIVISGGSSGGWFAVAAGMARDYKGIDLSCPGPDEPAVAAIVNWFGNWDLADVLEGPNAKPYAPGWVVGISDPLDLARNISPLPINGRPVPPVISIHGDADSVVPYHQSVRLHQALKAEGIAEELITIPGGGHGGFSRDENEMAYDAIWTFLSVSGSIE